MLRPLRLLPVVLALVCAAPSGLPSTLVRERSAPADVPIETEGTLALGSATFDRDGAHLLGVSVALRAVGRGAEAALALRPAPSASGPEVRYARAPGVTEWWRSLASGLEHGVTLAERPAGDGPLVLALDVGDAEVEADGPGALAIHGPHGRARYAGLLVVDAAGARIPARLEPAVGGARIVVDDEAARYPLLVDPLFVWTSERLFSGTADASCAPVEFGAAVAMSADGAWAVVGAPNMCAGPSANVGGALVYQRTATTWAFRAEFVGLGPGAYAGQAVAIDDAGAWAAVLEATRVTVHARTGTSWSLADQAVLPVPCDSVSMSGDGTRIVVGCAMGGTGQRVLSFENASGVLSPRTFPDVPAATAVALSGDGRRVLVTNVNANEAYVYRDTGSWGLDAGGTLGPALMVDRLGATGAISRNGLHVLLGSDASSGRRVHAFRFDGTTWVADGQVGTGTDADDFGASLAISDDGRRAAVAAPTASLTGIVRLFARDGAGWASSPGSDLSASTPTAARFGQAIALSRSGDRLVVGEPGERAAEVFRIADAAPNGGTCSGARDCLSGNCIDGMCCDTDCDERGSSCESCRSAETGRPDGTCAPRTAATICRASTGPCDVAEVCDGVVRACPAAALAASGTTCRPSMGDCDPAEVCDGTRAVCPGDVLSPMGAVCGTSATSCSSPGMCDGSRPTCGGTGAPRPLGTICGPADASNPCDVDDVCDGEGVCVPQHAPATTPCGIITPDGPCDGPDHCDGMAPSCVRGRLAGVECRAAAGTCDVAEVCAGVSGDCPPDGLLAAGVTCRDSLAACDPVESCDGSATCPADVNMCLPDAGEDPDGGVEALDGGDADVPSADAGPPAPVAGCACHVATDRRGPSSLLALIALTWLLARRR